MDYSIFKKRVYGYLSYCDIIEDTKVNELIFQNLEYLLKNCEFKYLMAKYDKTLPFMLNEPYASFLSGSKGYYLVVSTLGADVNDKISQLSKTEQNQMLIFDACANAYLELKNEEQRQSLGDELSYLFSPGYQGSDISDLRYILDELNSISIGVKLSSTGRMVPEKTMAGIYAIGVTKQKKCGNCIMLNDCVYRKAGKLCFHLENK